jgi:hypothetical protein
MKGLSEMNSLADEHVSFMMSMAPLMDALGADSLRERLRDNYRHRKQFSILASHRIYTVMGEE